MRSLPLLSDEGSSMKGRRILELFESVHALKDEWEVCMRTCICVYVCVYVCMGVCEFVHALKYALEVCMRTCTYVYVCVYGSF